MSTYGFKSECSDGICQCVLRVDKCFLKDGVVLVLNYAHTHAVEDLVGPMAMCVYLSKLSACQCIVAIIKLGYVSSHILRNDKLSTWVNLLIAIRSENQVITNDYLVARLDSMIDFCRSPLLEFPALDDFCQLIAIN